MDTQKTGSSSSEKLYQQVKTAIEEAITDYNLEMNERQKDELEKQRKIYNNPYLSFGVHFKDVFVTLEAVIANNEGLDYVGLLNKPLKKHIDAAVQTVQLSLIAEYGIGLADRYSENTLKFLKQYKQEVEQRYEYLRQKRKELTGKEQPDDPALFSWFAEEKPDKLEE